MIADSAAMSFPGTFNASLHPPGASRIGIIDFIASHLPQWRDDDRRPLEGSEDGLSDQLCKYLNNACRKVYGYNRYQFNRETRDESRRDRNLDIEVSPGDDELFVDGRVHTLYETVLAVECKRLPTPISKDRDEREYVITGERTTGGIQRFRRGDHGGNQPVVGMIAYVQDGTCCDWMSRVNGWIAGLAAEEGELTWNESDLLALQGGPELEPYRAKSIHARLKGLGEVIIEHVWIQMKKTVERPR